MLKKNPRGKDAMAKAIYDRRVINIRDYFNATPTANQHGAIAELLRRGYTLREIRDGWKLWLES